MDNSQQYKETLTGNDWRSLVVSTGNSQTWDPINLYVSHIIGRIQTQLETCTVSEVPELQGQIKAYRAILSLRDKAKKELAFLE